MLSIFKPAPHRARLPEAEIDPLYRRLRWQIFLGIFFGYAAYYLVRKNFALAMPYLVEQGFSRGDLGFALSGISIAYGFSKFIMGSVSDRSNPRVFLPAGLILAAGLGVLERNGVTNALINGGGDVLASGRLQGRPWRVGVRDPRAPDKLLGAIAIEGLGIVASSGDYERGFVHQGRRLHHVLDPQTGWPTQGVHGVALLARDVQAVNGWGTALMVQGMRVGPQWAGRMPGVAVLMAGQDGSVWQSSTMAAALQPA